MYLCEVVFSELTMIKSKYHTGQKYVEDAVSGRIKPSAETFIILCKINKHIPFIGIQLSFSVESMAQLDVHLTLNYFYFSYLSIPWAAKKFLG